MPHTSSSRLLLSNQDKGCTPNVAHSLPLPLGPALLNLWNQAPPKSGIKNQSQGSYHSTYYLVNACYDWQLPCTFSVFLDISISKDGRKDCLRISLIESNIRCACLRSIQLQTLLCDFGPIIWSWAIWSINNLEEYSKLTGGNWQKWKRVFLTCPCHKMYRDEAVGLKSCKYTWKITKFVKMGNLGQYRENLIFCQ